MAEKKRKKRGRGRAIAAVVVTLVLIAAAILALLYRERLSPDYLGDRFGAEDPAETKAEPFTYEAGSGQVFAVSGNNLAVASSTGIQLLDAKGRSIVREVFSMETPAISASAAHCVFYDAGGTELRVADADGELFELKNEERIISAHVNDSGYLTVITEETGYKAAVRVYNAKGEPLYAWHAGSAYVIAAQVSPSGRSLAALCADAEGGKLMLFSLSSEEPVGSYSAPNELFWDLEWMGREQLCLLSESRLVFLDESAQQTGEYAYNGRYLLDYDLSGGDYAVLHLGEYRTGGSGALVTVDVNGKESGNREIDQRDILSVSAGSDTVLVLYSDALELSSEALQPINNTKEILGVKKALIRKDGKCLLLSAYSAELIDLY